MDLIVFIRNKEDYKYNQQAIEQRSGSQMNYKYQSWRLISYTLNDGNHDNNWRFSRIIH